MELGDILAQLGLDHQGKVVVDGAVIDNLDYTLGFPDRHTVKLGHEEEITFFLSGPGTIRVLDSRIHV